MKILRNLIHITAVISIYLVYLTQSQITVDCTQQGPNIYSDLAYALGNLSSLNIIQDSNIIITINPQPSCSYTLGTNNLDYNSTGGFNLIITGNYSIPPSSLSSCNSSLAIITVNQSYALFQYLNSVTIQGLTFNIINASNALNIVRSSLFIQDVCFNIDTTEQNSDSSSVNYNFITILSAFQAPATLSLDNIYVNYSGNYFVSCEPDMTIFSPACTNQMITNPVGLIIQNTYTWDDLTTNPLNVTLQNINLNCNDAPYLPFLISQNVQTLTINNLNSNCLPNIEAIVQNQAQIANINLTNTTAIYPYPVQNIQNVFTITLKNGLNLTNVTFDNWNLNLQYDIGLNDEEANPIYLMNFLDNNTENVQSTIIISDLNITNNYLNGTLYNQDVSLIEINIMIGCISNSHIFQNINIWNNTVANVTNLDVLLITDTYNVIMNNVVYNNNEVIRIIGITQMNLDTLGTLTFSNIQITNSSFDMTDYTDISGSIPVGIIDIYVYDYYSIVNFNNVSILNNNINNTFFIQVLNDMNNNNFTNSTITFLSFNANNNTGKSNTFLSSGNMNTHFYYSSISYNNFIASSWFTLSTIGNPLQNIVITYSNLLSNTLYGGAFLINSSPLASSLTIFSNIMANNNGVLQLPFWLYISQTVIDGWNMYSECIGFQIAGVANMFFFNNTISNMNLYDFSIFLASSSMLTELRSLTFENASFYNYSGYFWNPSPNLTAVLNNTIFNQSQGLSYVAGALGFIYRITDNILSNIQVNLTNAFSFSTSMMNQSYIVIDNNVFDNWTMVDSTDNAIYFSEISICAISDNYWYNLSGKGYMVEIDTHDYLNISENYIYDCSSSFARMLGRYVINTNIIANTIDSTNTTYPFFSVNLMFSEGIISFISNTFTNINIIIDPETYLQITLITVNVIQSNSDIPLGFNMINNTFNNIMQDNNHPFIKQLNNPTLYISSPDNWINILDNNFANCTILYQSNFLSIIGIQIYITNNLFYNISNFCYYRGNIYILTQNLIVADSNFSYMMAQNTDGGVFHIDFDQSEVSNTVINITGCIFTNNFARLGSDLFYSGRNISYYESNNTRNYGLLTSIDLIFYEFAQVLSDYTWNGSFIGGFLAFDSCNILNFTIQNTLFNTKDINQGLMVNFESITGVSNITFLNITTNSNEDIISFVSLTNSMGITLIIDSLIIPNQTDILAFQLIEADSGFIEIRNLQIFNFSIATNSFISMICSGAANYSTLYIHDSLFSNFPIQASNVGIVHLSEKGGQSSCNLNLIAENMIFDQLYMENPNYDSEFGSFLYVDYLYNFSVFVDNCTFQNSTGNKGPSININNYDESIINITDPNLIFYNTSIIIQNSKFLNNTSYLEGGSIFNKYSMINVTNCTFVNNSALFRTGASIYSSNYTSLPDILTNQGNLFENNTRYAYYTAQNNKGLVYEDQENVGTLPKMLFPAPGQVFDWYSSEEIVIDQFNILNVSTYSLEHLEWNLYLIDYLDQVMYQDINQSTNDEITLPFKYIQMSTLGNLFSTNKCDMKWCNITNCTLKLQGNAYTNVSILISYLSSEFQIEDDIYNANLRPCIIGEINNTFIFDEEATSECNICEPGKYSLNVSDQICSPCPLNANCLNGGNDIDVNPGYWRSSVASYNIIPCRFSLACNGTYESICYTGYQGPLCNSCNGDLGFTRSKPEKCAECPQNSYQSTLLSVFTITLTMVYQVWFIKCTLISNRNFIKNDGNDEEVELQIKQGMYIRLLTGYSQIIYIVSSLRLNIINNLQEYVSSTAEVIGNPTSSSVGSTLCTVLKLGLNPNDLFYYKMIMISTLPFFKMGVIIFLRLVFWKFKLNKKRFSICIITIICIIIMDQPGLFSVLVSYLTCIKLDSVTGPELDTNSYIMSDLGYQCNTDEYNWYLYYFVRPSLLFWGIIVPVGFFIILYSHRKDLKSEHLRLNMGVIFNEYSDRAYFWGIILMVLKLLLSFISSTLYNDSKTNGLTIFMILYLYLMLLTRFKPYTDLQLYHSEQATIISFLLTIFFAIYYINNQFTTAAYIAEIIIVVTNLAVVFFLVYRIIELNMIKIRPVIHKIRNSISGRKSDQDSSDSLDARLNRSIEKNMNEIEELWPDESRFIHIELMTINKV